MRTMKKKRKRKREWREDKGDELKMKSKRQRLEHTKDRPLRYIFMFTHSLIANYEEIMKDSWSRSLKYVLPRIVHHQKFEELRLSVTRYLDELTISHFIEDDLVDQLFRFMERSSFPNPPLDDNLKYSLMEIKDKFFDDNMHRMEMKQGIRIMLRTLRESMKWTLCLIHKDSRETFNLILNDIGLRAYFNAFVCASSISNHHRPYSQLYEQAIARARIFKQQCLVLTEHIPEALETIGFGLYPILVSDTRPILDGEYFWIRCDQQWKEEVLALAGSIRDDGQRIYAMDTLHDHNHCFDEGDRVSFIDRDNRIRSGVIDKLFKPFPTKLYRVKWTDDEGNAKTSLKQNYFMWKAEGKQS